MRIVDSFDGRTLTVRIAGHIVLQLRARLKPISAKFSFNYSFLEKVFSTKSD